MSTAAATRDSTLHTFELGYTHTSVCKNTSFLLRNQYCIKPFSQNISLENVTKLKWFNLESCDPLLAIDDVKKAFSHT